MQSLPRDLILLILEVTATPTVRLISKEIVDANWKSTAARELFKRSQLYLDVFIGAKERGSRQRITLGHSGEESREVISFEDAMNDYGGKPFTRVCITDHNKENEHAKYGIWSDVRFEAPNGSWTPIAVRADSPVFNHVFAVGCCDFIVDVTHQRSLDRARSLCNEIPSNLAKLQGFYISFSLTVDEDIEIPKRIMENSRLKRLYISLPEQDIRRWPLQPNSQNLWTHIRRFFLKPGVDSLGIDFPNPPPNALSEVLDDWEKRPMDFAGFKFQLFWHEFDRAALFPSDGGQGRFLRNHPTDALAKAIFSYQGNYVNFMYESQP